MHRPMNAASRWLSVHSKRPHLLGCVSTGKALSFLYRFDLSFSLLVCKTHLKRVQLVQNVELVVRDIMRYFGKGKLRAEQKCVVVKLCQKKES